VLDRTFQEWKHKIKENKIIEYNEHFFPGIRAKHRDRKQERKSAR